MSGVRCILAGAIVRLRPFFTSSSFAVHTSPRHRWHAALFAIASGVFASSVAAQSSPPSSPDSAVAIYCAAWGATTRGVRDSLLARVWSADGVYSDPGPTLATGRAALSDTIEAFQRRAPGSRFRCSAAQHHHRMMRFTWSIADANGVEIFQGMDFGEFAADGRIRRIVGFFGAPPALAR